MEENKNWWQLKKMDRREYGNTAIVGLLAGYAFNLSGSPALVGIIGDTLALVGLLSGIVWIFLTIKEKISGKNKVA